MFLRASSRRISRIWKLSDKTCVTKLWSRKKLISSVLEATWTPFLHLFFISSIGHFLQYSSVYSVGEWCAGPHFSFVFLGRLESLSFERRCVTLGCLVQFQYLQHWSALLHPGKLLGTKHEAHISQPMREPHTHPNQDFVFFWFRIFSQLSLIPNHVPPAEQQNFRDNPLSSGILSPPIQPPKSSPS